MGDTEQEGQTRRKTVNMKGFSIPTASIHEEWLDLADIVNNDLENDLEKKKLSDISGFDVVGLFNNNSNNSDKSFQRQSSYLDIFKEIEGEELMLGIDSVRLPSASTTPTTTTTTTTLPMQQLLQHQRKGQAA